MTDSRSRIPSPARSQGGLHTPRRHPNTRKTLSVCSPRSTTSGRLSTLMHENRKSDRGSFILSPLVTSILPDGTNIEGPGRSSWWKDLGDNSEDSIAVLQENKDIETNNIMEELNLDVLSQEKRHYTSDLLESSDSESINSIILPNRRLFNEKEKGPQNQFKDFGTRETLNKVHKGRANIADITGPAVTKNRLQTKPSLTYLAELLDVSTSTTASDKTVTVVVKPKKGIRNMFANQQTTKHRNTFAKFIESDSEDEIQDISEKKPKFFDLQKSSSQRRPSVRSSTSKLRDPSPNSITTDSFADWNQLPSSTMVENQLEAILTDEPKAKKSRLSKLSEVNTSNSSFSDNKVKQTNKVSSEDKSKTEINEKSDQQKTYILAKNNSLTSQVDKWNKTMMKDKSLEHKTYIVSKNSSKTSQEDGKDTSKSMFKEKSIQQNTYILAKNNSTTSQVNKNISKTMTKEKSFEQKTNMNNSQLPQEANKDINNKNTLQALKLIEGSKENILDTNVSKTQSVARDEDVMDTNIKELETYEKEQIQENDELNFTLEYESDGNSDDVNIPDTHNQYESAINESNKKEKMEHKNDQENEKKCNLIYQNKIKNNHEKSENELNERHKKQNESQETENKNIQNENQDEHNKGIEIESNEVEKASQKIQNVSRVKESESQEIQNKRQEVENESQEVENESKKIQNVSREKESESRKIQNESQEVENESQEVENESQKIQNVSREKESESQEIQNERQVENENQEVENESLKIQNVSREKESESQEIKNKKQVVENESQEEDNESREIQNESQEAENESEEEDNESREIQNERQVVENESQEEDNESREIQNESQEAENESQEEDNESREILNESQEEDNESRNENQEDKSKANDESQEEIEVEDISQEAMELDNTNIDSQETEHDDSEVEEQESSTTSVESKNQINDEEADYDQNDNDSPIEEMDSPNKSHDTTGRNRIKSNKKTLETGVFSNSNAHEESFIGRGRNTSVRKSKSMMKPNIKPVEVSRENKNESPLYDGTKNSSDEGSGWDSHRTTRKTLRQTFGKNFTPRKSLRVMVMEKTAKIHALAKTSDAPSANSTDLGEPSMANNDIEMQDDSVESVHEASLRTRQATLKEYMQKISKEMADKRAKTEAAVKHYLEQNVADAKRNTFKVPAQPKFSRAFIKPKPMENKKENKKSVRPSGPLEDLPEEFVQDLNFKPPKRFCPRNAPWLTKHFYKFVENKLKPRYDYKARIRSEKFAETLHGFVQGLRRCEVASPGSVEELKHEMARLKIVQTHFDFYNFFWDFMPRHVRIKVVPDIVNQIPKPRNGIYSDIVQITSH